MAWQTFAALAAGNQPLSLFDTLAQQIAQCVVIPCTATGTNNISLTANANGPPVTAYNNYALFSFVAANTSTGNMQLQVASIGLLNLYNPGGTVQASTGSIVAGTYYVVAYQSQLNTGAGGFVIVSATPASLSVPVTVPNGGTGDTSMTAYAVVCGGTTSTNPLQPIASVGTVGQVLTSNGGGALPTMQNGGVTPLVTLTASSSASLQDTTHITGSYTRYMFVFQNIVLASSSADFTLQWHSGGIFQSTSYLCNSWGAQTGTGGGANLTTAVLLWSHTATVNVATAPGLTGFGCFSAPAAGYGFISGTFVGTNGVVVSTGISGGFWNNTGAIDGFSFQASTGNITSGAVTLYGLG